MAEAEKTEDMDLRESFVAAIFEYQEVF